MSLAGELATTVGIKQRARGGAQVLRMLPRNMQVKIATFQYEEKVLQRNDFLFAGCNNQFLQRVVVCLRDVYLMPDEIIMQASTPTPF